MSSAPTLAEAIRRALEARASEICTAIPARVESYDAATQRASVQPLIRRAFEDETGARQAERLPIISDVPVVFPGAGAYAITFPVAKGDTVLLVFSQASIDKWLTSGKDVDPGDDRRHSLNDAIAIPGLRHTAQPTGGSAAGALVLTAPAIHAGGTQKLALLSELNDLRSDIAGALNGDAIPAAIRQTDYPGTAVLKGA